MVFCGVLMGYLVGFSWFWLGVGLSWLGQDQVHIFSSVFFF